MTGSAKEAGKALAAVVEQGAAAVDAAGRVAQEAALGWDMDAFAARLQDEVVQAVTAGRVRAAAAAVVSGGGGAGS